MLRSSIALRVAIIGLSVLALAGCGGGGGSSRGGSGPIAPTNPPPPPPQPPSRPTADPASGFTFDFSRYSQPTGPNVLPKVYDKAVRGDFNGDGRDDLVAILQLNEIQVFLQRPDGTLAEPWVHQDPIGQAWRQILRIADFNKDGADDVVFDTVNEFSTPALSILLSKPGQQPEFVLRELPSVIQYGMSGTGPNGMLALDFNGDGNVDIIEMHNWKSEGANTGNCVPNETCPHIVLYPGDGQGALGEPQYFPWSGVPQPDARDFFVQDVDMDGRDDVVFLSLFGYPHQSKLYYMKRTVDGALDDPEFLVDMQGSDSPPAFGDLDGDGRTDMIYGNLIHLGIGDGKFGPPGRLALYSSMDSFWNVLGDFDGNGKTDVVNRQFAGFDSIPYFVTYLQKQGVLQAPFFLYDPPTDHTVNPDKWGRQAATTGDFNNDGCLDIAVAIGYDGILYLEGRNCMRAGP